MSEVVPLFGQVCSAKDAGTGLDRVSTSWNIEGVGDFNGDRTDDILWRKNDGTVAIWNIDGNSLDVSTGLGRVSTDWEIDFGWDSDDLLI